MKKYASLLFLLCFLTVNLSAQDFMLQGWYWDYPKDTGGSTWAQVLNDSTAALSASGFTYIWLPPLSNTSSGKYSNGYDPRDLFDLGEFSETRFGTRSQLNTLISTFNNNGIKAVADVVYNHRDGGGPEDNGAVEGWIENFNSTKVNSGDNAYPSDRFRCVLPIGGSTGRGAGTYYFKIRSASYHNNFFGKQYKVYMWTNKVGWKNQPAQAESEPNGGGDCGQTNNSITLGIDMIANIDDNADNYFNRDEFALTLTDSDFNAAGDTIFIVLSNTSSNYSDHYIYDCWYAPSGGGGWHVQNDIKYQTYTNFAGMPSGQGSMTYMNFKPNGNATQLSGDWDWPWFFYDYDQSVQSTKDVLWGWSRWLWTDVGIRGFRMDAVKHFPPSFVGDLLDNLHDNSIDPGLIVGEYYDDNSGALKGWVDNVLSNMDNDTKASISPRIFDFSLRRALKDACDTYLYDVRNVFGSGIVDGSGGSPFNVVTFTGNHDFRDAGQYIANDPILAYAYILTNNQLGIPCVFYKDYLETGMKEKIDALMNIHRNYIVGSSSRDYLSRYPATYAQSFSSGYATTTLVYQLKNIPTGRDVIVAINFAGVALDLYQQINMTNVKPGVQFTDLLGLSTGNLSVNGSNQVHIQLPARSYSVWAADEPLPVELSSFTANIKGNTVHLSWSTASEINNYGFEIQRNQNPKEWITLGFINGNGNSNHPVNYSYSDTLTQGGNYRYRLKQIDNDGAYEFSGTLSVTALLPNSLVLEQNYPNPFNPSTAISFTPDKSQRVTLKVYDLLGKEVATLFDSDAEAGRKYNIEFNAAGLSSGIYYYKLETPEGFRVMKMILLQ